MGDLATAALAVPTSAVLAGGGALLVGLLAGYLLTRREPDAAAAPPATAGPNEPRPPNEPTDPAEATRAQGLLEATLSSMGEGLMVLDADLRVLVLNSALRRFFDIPGDLGTDGIPVQDLLLWLAERGRFGPAPPEEIVGTLIERLAETAAGDEPAFEIELADGRTFLVSADRLPRGGLVTTLTDVTEQKNTVRVLSHARDVAEQANAAKTEFLATMTHELRTPLNAIIGFAGMIRDERQGPIGVDAYRTYAADIGTSGRLLLDMINDILDVARLEAGTLRLSEAILDPRPMLDAIIDEFTAVAQESRVTFAARIADPLPTFRGDETRLRQALRHVLSNAIKFSGTGKSVVIAAAVDRGGALRFEISDQGVGMTPDQIAVAREPFRQVESSLDRSFAGTGIGLAIVDGIVTLHGGSVDIESTPGEGTTVSIRLPASRIATVDPRFPADAPLDDW